MRTGRPTVIGLIEINKSNRAVQPGGSRERCAVIGGDAGKERGRLGRRGGRVTLTGTRRRGRGPTDRRTDVVGRAAASKTSLHRGQFAMISATLLDVV